ncbi:hypothetical protein SR1949_23740 [Sphaerospermopsis reniformis]|uniref:Glycerophosphoryl diester phosphodiesterase membrane domain-containing protein n=1 Tax=Sphaerospermopsis reniformis TaxID=531300 RepID=A0A480A0A1_9CYAN|nr:DUF975 domain-containing protein [Sphaerospermopsis reniformis]GCL37266.1 hypothetical protein SR1949_23740 [Sphaerospermopsis reniformis]
MSDNLGYTSNAEPLSIGNVVSAAVRLYRSHLKEYFILALKAYLWVLLPIYGWAKFYALSALIGRLAFGDLVNQPESVHAGERFVNSRLWKFFGTLILMFFISVGIMIGFLVAGGLLLGIMAAVLGVQNGNLSNIGIFVLIAILVSVVGIVGIVWLGTRFYVVDLPLAIEENVDAISTIQRSWELTKGYVGRIFIISFVALLITLPLQILVQIITNVIELIFTTLLADGSPVFSLIFIVLFLGILVSSNAAILPFLQTVKAVIYYDLRSRREGLGLELRDREI